MKKSLRCLIIGLLGCSSFGLFNASADLEVSTTVKIRATTEFHAPLSPHGVWVEAKTHGRCWRPARVAVSWRPYSSGSWVWTDCGWYWESDEPWAWACYHYGSWVDDPVYGWVWVPGIEWAPAWVTWRVGGGYCGWAPLAPRGVIVAAPAFVFVETHRFHEPIRPSLVVVNNTTVLNKTKEVASFKRETRNLDGSGPRKVIVNEGPGRDVVQMATGKKIETVSIREATRKAPAPDTGKARPPGGRETPQLAPQQPPAPRPPIPRGEGRPQKDRGEGKRGGPDKDK